MNDAQLDETIRRSAAVRNVAAGRNPDGSSRETVIAPYEPMETTELQVGQTEDGRTEYLVIGLVVGSGATVLGMLLWNFVQAVL